MGRTGPKLPSFCLNRIRPLVRVRSPPIQQKFQVNSVKADHYHKVEGPNGTVGEDKTENGAKPSSGIGRKIMIVVDSSFEAKGALQWALSHSVQSQDKLLLLHVTKQSSRKGEGEELTKESAPRAYELVHSLRNMCKSKKPEVEIDVLVVEGKEKGPTIVEEAKKQGVDLLVLGQKKRSTTWRLLMMWAAGHRVNGGGGGGGGVVEYCIQNATCMAIAVRRKNRRLGGYLITTKRHKDFWLLA